MTGRWRCWAGRPTTPCRWAGSVARSTPWSGGAGEPAAERRHHDRVTPTGSTRSSRTCSAACSPPTRTSPATPTSTPTASTAGLQAYEELGIPVAEPDPGVADRRAEPVLRLGGSRRADLPDLVLGRRQLPVADRGHRGDARTMQGAEIPAEVVVPHVMREVTEADCDPDRANPVVSGTSLVPDEILAMMFSERMIDERFCGGVDPRAGPRAGGRVPPVRGGPGADRRQLRLPARRGPCARR